MPLTVPTLTDVVVPPVAPPSNREPVRLTAGSARAPLVRVAPRGRSLPSVAIGALAFGALALGALAIGQLAIAVLAVRRARIHHLRVDDLDIGNLHLGEPHTPPARR